MNRRLVTRLSATLLLLALAFLAWPLWSGWQLRQAMRARDIASLQSRVDWTTLRTNLKPRLTAAIEDSAKDSGSVGGYLKRMIGGAVADKGVDLFVTPQNLSRILAGREFITARMKRGTDQVPPTAQTKKAQPEVQPSGDDPEEPDDPMPPRRLKWAFFESPTRFRYEATHPRLPSGRIVAHLALQGFGWKLVDVTLSENR
jgi:hypothetical protein